MPNVSTQRERSGAATSVLAVCVAVVFVTTMSAVPGTAAAQDNDGEDTAAEMRLAGIPPFAVPGETLPVIVGIETDADPDSLEVAFELGPRIGSRSAFESAIEGENPSSILQLITADLVPDPTGSGYNASIDPEVANSGRTSDARIVLRSSGVYPLEIVLRESGSVDELASLTTFVVRMDDAAAVRNPLRFAWVWPVYASPPAQPGDGDDRLRRDLARGRLKRIADAAAATDAPITYLFSPDTMRRSADLAATPGAAESLRMTFDALVASGTARELLASPYARVATDAWGAVTPEADPQFANGAATLEQVFEKSPNRSTQLTVGDAVPSSGVRMLASQGAAHIVLPEDAVEDPGLNVTLTNTFRLTGLENVRAVLADADLAASLDDPGGPVAAAQRLLADLTILHADAPNTTRGAVLVPPAAWSPASRFLSEALGRIRAAAYVEMTPLASFFGTVPDAEDSDGDPLELDLADPEAVPPPEELTQYQAAMGVRAGLNIFRSMMVAGPPTGIPEHLLLESLDATLIQEDASLAYSQRVDDAIRQVLGRVETPAGQNITITSRSASIPVSVRNDSRYTLRVQLTLESAGLRFPEGRTREIELPPRTVTTDIPVEAPSNGTFDASVRVSSPDGALLVSETRIEVRSTAVNAVALALSIGSVVFLLLWWALHSRRNRKQGKHVRRHRHPVFHDDPTESASDATPERERNEGRGESGGEPDRGSPDTASASVP